MFWWKNVRNCLKYALWCRMKTFLIGAELFICRPAESVHPRGAPEGIYVQFASFCIYLCLFVLICAFFLPLFFSRVHVVSPPPVSTAIFFKLWIRSTILFSLFSRTKRLVSNPPVSNKVALLFSLEKLLQTVVRFLCSSDIFVWCYVFRYVSEMAKKLSQK